jgi:hypothetical protein
MNRNVAIYLKDILESIRSYDSTEKKPILNRKDPKHAKKNKVRMNILSNVSRPDRRNAGTPQ